MFQILRYLSLVVYYAFARYLPDSYTPLIGKICNKIRIALCRNIFKRCGKVSTINRMAFFGNESEVEIGDLSGIGAHCHLTNNIKIGNYVMMGPSMIAFPDNHDYADTSKPMCLQGKHGQDEAITIDDDCWIGERVIINCGKHIGKGVVIAAGSVIAKDVNDYEVVGGNPAKLIKMRK